MDILGVVMNNSIHISEPIPQLPPVAGEFCWFRTGEHQVVMERGTLKLILRYYGENVRMCTNGSETHETVLLDCTTGEAGSAIQ